jgi:hypothetical protein
MAKSKQKKKKISKAGSGRWLGAAMPERVMFDAPRMEVVDYLKWGNLIKSWSRDPTTAPKNLQDFVNQCEAAGVGLSMPASVTGMQVIVQKENEFILRLPPASSIEETEDLLRKGGLYPIPRFYDDAYGVPLRIDGVQPNLNFHARRIGDYSIRKTA